MSEELSTSSDTTPLVDDATVVYDEAKEEKGHEELVSKVGKLLEETPGQEPETPGKPEEAAEEVEAPQAEAESETLSEALQARAKDAGLTEDLAQELHKSGQLEQTLAAIDRRLIDYVQSQESKDSEKEGEKDKPSSEDDTALDPDIYDEAIIARDAAQTKRIEALEAMVAELTGSQSDGFDQWFDGTLKELGVNPSDDDKCQTVFKAYEAVCRVYGKDPNARDPEMVRLAHAAKYPQDVFKKTVERLRDSDGKFVSSPASRGAPPPKGATDEEVHEHLVSQVGAYLKEQGVEMSGY